MGLRPEGFHRPAPSRDALVDGGETVNGGHAGMAGAGLTAAATVAVSQGAHTGPRLAIIIVMAGLGIIGSLIAWAAIILGLIWLVLRGIVRLAVRR